VKDGVVEAIRAAGGEIFAITSEPQTLATNAQVDWDTSFEHIGDPHQEISKQCSDRGWITLLTEDADLFDGRDGGGDTSWISHPGGFFQPGVLALSKEDRVLYRWTSTPSRKNVGGASMRPTAAHVWSGVKTALAAPAGSADAAVDDNPQYDSAEVPWPLFIMMLLANGWFVKPAFFLMASGAKPIQVRMRTAMKRLAGFGVAWILAFTFLPIWLSALAAVSWCAWVTPFILGINSRIPK
jgi:hypothetical protein